MEHAIRLLPGTNVPGLLRQAARRMGAVVDLDTGARRATVGVEAGAVILEATWTEETLRVELLAGSGAPDGEVTLSRFVGLLVARLHAVAARRAVRALDAAAARARAPDDLPRWPSEVDWSRVRALRVHGWDDGHVYISIGPFGSYDLANEPELINRIKALVLDWLAEHPPVGWDARRRERGYGALDWLAWPPEKRDTYLHELGL